MIPDFIDETALNIFVDGASLPGPRRGGLGIRYVWVDAHGHEQSEAEPFPYSHEGASSNQMELEAPIKALKTTLGRHPPVHLTEVAKVIIYLTLLRRPSVQRPVHLAEDEMDQEGRRPSRQRPSMDGAPQVV